MTELLYLKDSYIDRFEGKVVEVSTENNGIILNQTAFYPGGGGQPPDRGLIEFNGSEIRIKRARKIGNSIIHIMEEEFPAISPGDSVNGFIDWERRYELMRTHTAMHILCGVIFRDYGASVTGGDMEPLKGRMDFEFETMHKELVQEIEKSINQEASKGLEVRTEILPREKAFQIPDLIRTKINLLPEGIQNVRVVEITGLDLQADGGTHVRNTKEVGEMRVVNYKSKGKINKRIYVEISGTVNR